MKTIKILSIVFLTAMSMTSCVEKSEKYLSLLAQRDSLLMVELHYNQAIDILNAVEKGIADIREIESRLQAPGSSVEGNRQLVQELKQIKNIVVKNKEQIAELEKKLKAANGYSASLANSIKRLKEDIASKESMIETLKGELVKKDVDIAALNTTIGGLNENISGLHAAAEEQKKVIAGMDKEMNKVYYLVAENKVLKEKGVIEGGALNRKVLSQEVDPSLFTASDVREVKEIATGGKKMKLMTPHPAKSYSIELDADGNAVIRITDAKAFWSISRYLVVRL